MSEHGMTPPPPVTRDQVHRARLAVLRSSRSQEDAKELLDALGIGRSVRIPVSEAVA